jgi:hypothetical protein
MVSRIPLESPNASAIRRSASGRWRRKDVASNGRCTECWFRTGGCRWYKSKVTGSWRHALVYLPPGYDTLAKVRYPVLYLQLRAPSATIFGAAFKSIGYWRAPYRDRTNRWVST